MIISASRRTDIPAFFSPWLAGRMKEGWVTVRNPFNSSQARRIDLSPDAVDGIVFWTRDASPLMDILPLLSGYHFYVQYTITGYGRDLEPGVPAAAAAADTFRRLSDAIGRERVIWRFDPLGILPRVPVEELLARFARLSEKIAPWTRHCVISFLDIYTKAAARCRVTGFRPPDEREVEALAVGLSELAGQAGIGLSTCAEPWDLERFGITHGACIDADLLARISGRQPAGTKDPRQRPECRCAVSVDIGTYGTCRAGCIYCYARR